VAQAYSSYSRVVFIADCGIILTTSQIASAGYRLIEVARSARTCSCLFCLKMRLKMPELRSEISSNIRTVLLSLEFDVTFAQRMSTRDAKLLHSNALIFALTGKFPIESSLISPLGHFL